MILADVDVGGTTHKALVHFDRNGPAYTLDRNNGALLVAEKYDPTVNWATKVDMDKNSKTYGRPLVVADSTQLSKPARTKHQGRVPCRARYQGSAAGGDSPDTKLFYVPTNHVCMDYEPFRVSYTAGQPHVECQ